MVARRDVLEAARERRRGERLREVVRVARKARDLPPEDTLAIGFDLIRFARRLRDAAETTLVRGRG